MILIDENKLTNGTIIMIGQDLGIHHKDIDESSWAEDPGEYLDYVINELSIMNTNKYQHTKYPSKGAESRIKNWEYKDGVMYAIDKNGNKLTMDEVFNNGTY